jgi:hypothetical protein
LKPGAAGKGLGNDKPVVDYFQWQRRQAAR